MINIPNKSVAALVFAAQFGVNALAQTPNSSLFPSSPPAKATCTADISPWFIQNPITANGVVKPADSLFFSDATNCNFYKWSWQMFLWLTTNTGTDGDLVLNTNPFFDFDLSTGGLVTDADLSLREEKVDSTEEASGNAYIFGDNELVYFGVHTNQTYAFFSEMNIAKQLKPAATQFPTKISDVIPVYLGAYENYGIALQDVQTLAMELKTSWVRASAVPDSSKYVTITASIPTYDKKTDPTKWTVSGSKPTELALVGIHIVGSVKGRPEMVWASFEHIDNAPNDSFEYLAEDGSTNSYSNFDSGSGKPTKDWLFMSSNISKSSITLVPGKKFFSGSIKANNTVSGGVISSSNESPISGQSVYRQFPWGTKSGVEPTPPAESNKANNTDIISINQNVMSQLAEGDLRANYFLLGATWTNGKIPPGKAHDPAIVKGSLVLANTTMETFIQGQNCFACHSGDPLTGLSHIYGKINPQKFEPIVLPPLKEKKMGK